MSNYITIKKRLGTIGNIRGLYLLATRRLVKIGTRKMYSYFLLVDTVYLLTVVKLFLQYGFEIDLSAISSKWCKIYAYFSYSISSIPPFLAFYISLERYISIKHHEQRYLFINQRNQLLYFISIIVYNFLFYAPVLSFYDLNDKETSNLNDLFVQCSFIGSGKIPLALILMNRITLPFGLMTWCIIILIKTVFETRKIVFTEYTFSENKKFRFDVKMTLLSVMINAMIILFNIPVIVVHFFFVSHTNVYLFTLYLFVMRYGINYYLIILSNRIFRDRCLYILLGRKKSFRYVNRSANLRDLDLNISA